MQIDSIEQKVLNLSHLIFNHKKLQIENVKWKLNNLEGLMVNTLLLNPLGLLPLVVISRSSFWSQMLMEPLESLYVGSFPHSNILYFDSLFAYFTSLHIKFALGSPLLLLYLLLCSPNNHFSHLWKLISNIKFPLSF